MPYADLEPVPIADTDPSPDEVVARALLRSALQHLDHARPDLAAGAARLSLVVLDQMHVDPSLDPATGDLVLVQRGGAR